MKRLPCRPTANALPLLPILIEFKIGKIEVIVEVHDNPKSVEIRIADAAEAT
jgi:hypothetical protein